MRVFVTGATGLVGRHLVPFLQGRGDQVLALTRSLEPARKALPEATVLVEADPRQPGSWQDELLGCDAVVNLAGEPVGQGIWTAGKKKSLRRSRLATTEHVVQALSRDDRPRVLISGSATGYYGNGKDAALGEDAEPGHDFLARLAMEWERAAAQAASEQVRVVLLRTGVVLARQGGALAKLLLPFKLGLGGPLGSGRQYFPWIHIQDLVRIIAFALDESALRGPVNAAVPDPPTQKEFARALGRVLGKPAVIPTPGIVLQLILGEKADLVLASQRVVPSALRAQGFHFAFSEAEAALADLLDETASPD